MHAGKGTRLPGHRCHDRQEGITAWALQRCVVNEGHLQKCRLASIAGGEGADEELEAWGLESSIA